MNRVRFVNKMIIYDQVFDLLCVSACKQKLSNSQMKNIYYETLSGGIGARERSFMWNIFLRHNNLLIIISNFFPPEKKYFHEVCNFLRFCFILTVKGKLSESSRVSLFLSGATWCETSEVDVKETYRIKMLDRSSFSR